MLALHAPHFQTFPDDELGPLLRILRKRRGLTLSQSAKEMGVSASALSQAERNVPGVERLALRAVNEHLAKAAEDGIIRPGSVRRQFQAYGSARDFVSILRHPERERRGNLLRQALLARRFKIDPDPNDFRIGATGSIVRIDLNAMIAYIDRSRFSTDPMKMRFGENLGYIVDLDDNMLDDDVWAQSIDRFAGALEAACEGGKFDPDALKRALQAPLPATPPLNSPIATTD